MPRRTGVPDAAALPTRPRVVVVGAGIAGLAAATGLAERGVTVDIVERRRYLGGRVGGWTESLPDGTAVAMNRGFHAFFRQYYNLRNLLRRIDPELSMLTPVDDYPLVDATRPPGHFPGLAADAAVQRVGIRAAQSDVSATGSDAAQRPRCRAARRGVGARHLPSARPSRRRFVPA